MRFLFLISAALIFVSYAGYPLYLYVRSKFWPMPIHRGPIFCKVTVVMAVHNDRKYLMRKLRNLAALEYAPDCLEIVIVSDGSTDGTNEILAHWTDCRFHTLILPERQGKANAINRGVERATGEIICFTDVRQMIAAEGLKQLASNFADSTVGCASGALTIWDRRSSPGPSDGVGIYWRLEKKIRDWEGLTGSTVGATGAFYAVRKENLVTLPMGTILDDVYIPLHVARQGKRVIFDPESVAWDCLAPGPRQEFRRKVRTLVGNYQLLQAAPWIVSQSNPLRLRFICHKLLRLLVPFALLAILLSTSLVREGMFGFLLALQVALYGLAVLGMLRIRTGLFSRIANISMAFVIMNTAAAVAFFYFITGKKEVWAR